MNTRFAAFPTDCVLCDFSGETHEEYEQHMDDHHPGPLYDIEF